jgi:hypothetical protein
MSVWVAPRGIAVMVMAVVDSDRINVRDHGMSLWLERGFTKRVMRRREPGCQQRQKRRKEQSSQQDYQGGQR